MEGVAVAALQNLAILLYLWVILADLCMVTFITQLNKYYSCLMTHIGVVKFFCYEKLAGAVQLQAEKKEIT